MKLTIGQGRMSYTMELNDGETQLWATRLDNSWPDSTIAGRRLKIQADDRGLVEFAIAPRADGGEADIHSEELAAIVADFLPPILRHLWPVWNSGTMIEAHHREE